MTKETVDGAASCLHTLLIDSLPQLEESVSGVLMNA
jgi:hypothetical protein